MGIKHLSSLLREKCKGAITCFNLSQLKGKKIAVDTSIYLYKYKSDGALIENFYMMLSLFRHYQIEAIFVLDGKPPAEKKALIEIRRNEKNMNIIKLKDLKHRLSLSEDLNFVEKAQIENQIVELSRKTVKVTIECIEKIKILITGFGMSFYQAKREADEVCAYLTITGLVYACLSEDNDMFLYGCPRVLRYLNLSNHSIVLYDFKKILLELGFSHEEFSTMCICSGTDYLANERDIFEIYENIKGNELTYNVVTCNEVIHKHFNPMSIDKKYLKLCDNIIISNYPCKIAYDIMRPILIEDGFIFPKTN
jgi:5'-3' exonuclease